MVWLLERVNSTNASVSKIYSVSIFRAEDHHRILTILKFDIDQHFSLHEYFNIL